MRSKNIPPLAGRLGGDGSSKAAITGFSNDRSGKSNILVFPAFKGHYRCCAKCRRPYQLPAMACTIRDGRQTHCPDCFLDVAVKVHNEYKQGVR